MVLHWITWIQIFDFLVQHIPGKKNVVVDSLSRWPITKRSQKLAELENTEEFLDQQFNMTHWVNNSTISANTADSGEEIHWLMPEEEWTLESLEIAKWLQTLQKPDRMSRAQYQQF